MAYSYPLDFPTTIGVTDSVLSARAQVARSESPFSFADQVYDWGGQQWQLDITMPFMTRAQVEEFNCFLLKLNGRKGTFTCYVPGAKEPRGDITQGAGLIITTEGGDTITTELGDSLITEVGGDITVYGAGQTGTSLVVSGFAANQTGVLFCGDLIQLGSGSGTQLYKILSDADSGATGTATLDIWPSLRSSPSHGAAVITSSPKGLFRLADNITAMPSDKRNLYSISFSAVEAISGS